MTSIQSLWLTLLALYQDSYLHRLLVQAGAWCNRQIDGSQILSVLCRETQLSRAWPKSCLCRILTALINLPAWLLHKLYEFLPGIFQGSFFARFAFRIGDETAIAQSWVILFLWIIPFQFWNNAYSMLGFVFLLFLFYAGAMPRTSFRLNISSIGFYPILFFAAVILGVVFSYSRADSMRFLIYHVSAALCVLITVSAVRNSGDLKRLGAASGFCVLVSSIYGVYQRIQGVAVNQSYVDIRLNEGMPGRVESFFDNPNTFAEVLMLLLPIIFALILCSKRPLSKLIACGIFILGVVVLGMTYSRASWVGMACAMVVFVFLWKPKLIPLFIILCIAAIPLLPDTIWNRILTIGNFSDSSTTSRVPLYQAAIAAIQSSPISGVGLGTAAIQKYIKAHNLYHGVAPYVHAHSFFLEVWLETGILGLISFLGAILSTVQRTARIVRHNDQSKDSNSTARTIACAGAASLCGALVCGLADYLWNYPRVMCMFWFVFALTIAAVKICQSENQDTLPSSFKAKNIKVKIH